MPPPRSIEDPKSFEVEFGQDSFPAAAAGSARNRGHSSARVVSTTVLPASQQQQQQQQQRNNPQPPSPEQQPRQQQQQQSSSRYQNPPSSRQQQGKKQHSDHDAGPIDLDELFSLGDWDDQSSSEDSLFDNASPDEFDEDPFLLVEQQRYYSNPNQRSAGEGGLLDRGASLIPGSPFSKPGNMRSTRPAEPLSLAKYAASVALLVTLGWIAFLFFVAISNYNNVGRIVVEVILAIIAFFGLFWNVWFITSSIFKMFIPAKAFRTNTKYCSMIPETKPPEAEWLDVTIQIPVYKESLQQVLMPTLRSCMKARDHYAEKTDAKCNIVVCDDGMMAFLRDNFAAAEMLWDAIVKSQGRKLRLSKLLKTVPVASRKHLKGMRSKNVYEAFHRMLFYFHFKIGFVARSTVDRRGKFKKASNLNSHLRLALGAAQRVETEDGATFASAALHESHNRDGSRFVMFGNDIQLGELICVNDADARMAPSVIRKTVPEFLNDHTLGFTQHATKTLTEQRGESYFTNLLAVYTDALYQGHFLLSSIMGCHPPLVGHSIFLRTEAVKQCGRMRMLRHAQRWLRNIGLPFLPVDQVGFSNLQANNRAEYWSERHVSEDFELMIHLYNLGFNGRYCAYPNCEFQEGITRTFDEEAGRHRKFALGAHELVFNPLAEMLGHGIFTPLFRTFMSCDIPSYYKVFLTAYLCSYAAGGAYIIVFVIATVARLLDTEDTIDSIYDFSPAGIIILNIAAFYVIGYFTFLVSLLRMHYINSKLLFPEYRKKCCGALYLVFVKIRYCLVFQFLFYTVTSITFYFLGSMDHMLSRENVCTTTNKDAIVAGRCVSLYHTIRFNIGSWCISFILAGLAYVLVLQDTEWDPSVLPDNWTQHLMFSGPPLFLAFMAIVSPLILNPYILGWPFLRAKKSSSAPRYKPTGKKDALGRIVDIKTFMATQELDDEIERVQNRPDVELGTVKDLYSENGSYMGGSPMTTSKHVAHPALGGRQVSNSTSDSMPRISETAHYEQDRMLSLPAPIGGSKAGSSRTSSTTSHRNSGGFSTRQSLTFSL